MEWISGGKELLGLLLGVIALLGIGGRWFWGRVSSRVKSDFSGLTTGHDDIKRRLVKVEEEQAKLRQEVHRMDESLRKFEAHVGSLSTREDVSQLAVALAEVKATSAGTSQMMDTLYRAIMERAGQGR